MLTAPPIAMPFLFLESLEELLDFFLPPAAILTFGFFIATSGPFTCAFAPIDMPAFFFESLDELLFFFFPSAASFISGPFKLISAFLFSGFPMFIFPPTFTPALAFGLLDDEELVLFFLPAIANLISGFFNSVLEPTAILTSGPFTPPLAPMFTANFFLESLLDELCFLPPALVFKLGVFTSTFPPILIPAFFFFESLLEDSLCINPPSIFTLGALVSAFPPI